MNAILIKMDLGGFWLSTAHAIDGRTCASARLGPFAIAKQFISIGARENRVPSAN